VPGFEKSFIILITVSVMDVDYKAQYDNLIKQDEKLPGLKTVEKYL